MKTEEKAKETWKEKRARKRKEFEEKHPKLYDFLVKAAAVTVVVGPLILAYSAGYSDGSKLSPKAVQENFEKSSEEIDKLHQEWLQKQRDAYLENFNNGAYASNAAEFQSFARNFNLQPGEAYFIWDDNQFKGEGLEVDQMIDHQVYGITDPNYAEMDYNPWEMD